MDRCPSGSGGKKRTGPGRLLVALAIVLCLSARADTVVAEFDFTKGDARGWEAANRLTVFDLSGGVLATQAMGADAFMHVAGLALPTADITHVVFRMRSDKGGPTQVYYTTDDEPGLAGKPVPTVNCSAGNVWRDYSVKLAGLPGFTGTLTLLRLDPVQGAEDARIEFESVRLIRMDPRLRSERFSTEDAIPHRGKTVPLVLRYRNDGGPLNPAATDIRIAATDHVSLDSEFGTPTPGEDDAARTVRWILKAERPGLATIRTTLSTDGCTRLDATALLPVIDTPGDLTFAPAKPPPAGTYAANRALALTVLGSPDGSAGAAVLHVRNGGAWRAAALLSPLAHVARLRGDSVVAEDVRFETVNATGDRLSFSAARDDFRCRVRLTLRGDGTVDVRSEAEACGDTLALLRFSGPVLRIGLGPGSETKDAGLFPGHEFLEGNEPSSNRAVIGKFLHYRPHPDPRSVTVPVPAILRDGALVGMMWDPLQDWGGPADSMPAAEFASPNFADRQANHLVTCFVPGLPERRPEAGSADRPYPVPRGKTVRLTAKLFAIPGADITDAVPLWYRTYGQPAPPKRAYSDAACMDLLMQGYSETLFDAEKRGFTTHYKFGDEEPRWIPSFAARVLIHGIRTGDGAPAEAIGLADDATPLSIVGSMFSGLKIPEPHGFIATQTPAGHWAYREKTRHNVAEFSGGFADRLGREGAVYVGYTGSVHALPVLAHALAWGDAATVRSGLKALDAMLPYRVPRGAQAWEVPAETPDLYAAARLADCFLIGYKLTGETKYLEKARYWLYTGLPFLYAYRVPGTGPGVKVLLPGKGQVAGDVYYRDTDTHESTPYGSIPVFGTSLYRVSWFGTLVQFCGLVWARSVYDYLEVAENDVILRTAADGATRVGANITLDRPPYAGLLPDGFDIPANRAQGALIGPMRVEPALRAVMDLPELGGVKTTLVRGKDDVTRLHSHAVISRVRIRPRTIGWKQRFLPGYACETLVFPVRDTPESVRCGFRLLPRVEDLTTVEEGWAPVGAVEGIGIRVRHQRETEVVEIRLP